MDQPNVISAVEDDDGLSPYRVFSRDEWAKLPGIGNSLAETLVEYAKAG